MLKNTGVIRKIDELGRIVIPKEIRTVLKINSGDDLEIFIEDNQIILKKYSLMKSLQKESNHLIESVSNLVDSNIYISDKEKIITKGTLENKELPNEYKKMLYDRKGYISSSKEKINFDDIIFNKYVLIEPIIQNSDANGLIIITKEQNITKEDKFFIKVLKNIIENK